jgi:hypothetical protein
MGGEDPEVRTSGTWSGGAIRDIRVLFMVLFHQPDETAMAS